jgi:hypothetical protein
LLQAELERDQRVFRRLTRAAAMSDHHRTGQHEVGVCHAATVSCAPTWPC